VDVKGEKYEQKLNFFLATFCLFWIRLWGYLLKKLNEIFGLSECFSDDNVRGLKW
jgi:hypothetical protein